MHIECDNMDFTTFQCSDLISRQLVIEIMAKELRDKNDDDRSVVNRMRMFLSYRISKNQLVLQSDSFVSGQVAYVLRKSYPGKFIGWTQTVDGDIDEHVKLGDPQHPTVIPSDVARKDEMILRLTSELQTAELERDALSADAKKWREKKVQQSRDGKKGGRPARGK